MRFHDETADRQPHAAALRFRGEEGIEDLIRSSGRQSSRPIVVQFGPDLRDELQFLESLRVSQLRQAGIFNPASIPKLNGTVGSKDVSNQIFPSGSKPS